MSFAFPHWNKMPVAISLFLLGCLTGCYSGRDHKPNIGIWRGTLRVQQQDLPFNFEVTSSEPMSYQFHLINGEERITTDNVRIRGDSLFATMHIFDTELQVKLTKSKMQGVWVKNYSDGYVIPFHASYGESFRFKPGPKPVVDISGKWQVQFSKDTVPGIGIFIQHDSRVVGTFLTASGDYRYLEGAIIDDSLFLSAFDGEHAFLFNALVQDGSNMKGEFRSGSHFFDSWSAVQDPSTELVNPDSITFLKPGYETINFSFPDLNGKTVSLSDQKFQDKVVVLQLFGSWCPNCMDETKFLSSWYNANRGHPVEIIGLAYERLDDYSYAKGRLNKMALKFDVNYELLVAGTSDKDLASKTLPMLNQINSFPTTIFIDHRGAVRKIHTGFMGPGTGQYYLNFISDFETFINQLVEEKAADTTHIDKDSIETELLVP